MNKDLIDKLIQKLPNHEECCKQERNYEKRIQLLTNIINAGARYGDESLYICQVTKCDKYFISDEVPSILIACNRCYDQNGFYCIEHANTRYFHTNYDHYCLDCVENEEYIHYCKQCPHECPQCFCDEKSCEDNFIDVGCKIDVYDNRDCKWIECTECGSAYCLPHKYHVHVNHSGCSLNYLIK